MADEIEAFIPDSVQNDGHLKIIAMVSGNALSVAVLKATPAKDVTYGFTDDGFDLTATESVIEDKRLTLAQVLQQAGRTTEDLNVKYVFGGEDDSMRALFVEGTKGTFTARYAVPHGQELAVGDEVDVVYWRAGRQIKVKPTENGVWTIQQRLYIYKPSLQDKKLIA